MHLVCMRTSGAYTNHTNAILCFLLILPVFTFFFFPFLSEAARKTGRNQSVPEVKIARTISVKDVVAVLEREPQMSKSTLIYQLYERTRSDHPLE